MSKSKNIVELKSELGKTGIEHVYVDGRDTGITIGYTSEADKRACLEAIQKAIEASDGDIYTAMMKLNCIATFNDKDVVPEEQIKVKGVDFIVNYTNKTLYTMNGEEFVDCKDITCAMPKEGIQALLISRAETKLKSVCSDCDCDCEDEDEDDDDEQW